MAINSLPVSKHEDDRRILVEWLKDFPVKSCKVLVAKDDCEVGNHHHKIKDEIFYLLKGKGTVTLNGESETIKEGDVIYVPKDTIHSFVLEKDSILLGAGTKPYDPDDEYK